MEAQSSARNPVVFLDFHVRGAKVGRVILELHQQNVPQTCENFRALCTGERGVGVTGHQLHFKGSSIHKVVSNILLQGGDITNHDGSGGDTIYGRVYKINSDKISPNCLKFDEAGLLGLAKSMDRPDEYTSQFFITVDPCPHLEGGNIAFGKVLKGLDIVRELSSLESVKNVPVEKIVIGSCGEIKPGEDWGYIENDGSVDVYPPYPSDWEPPNSNFESVIKAAEDIKVAGNLFYNNGEFSIASRKYEKALRYWDWAKKLNGDVEVGQNLYITCLLNWGACKLKLQEYAEARSLCSAVISRNEKLVKAFFRRGKANFGLREYDAAMEDFAKAHELDKNEGIVAEIVKVEEAKKKYLAEEKKTCAAMLK